MKKTTIYMMLCSTVIFSESLLAADEIAREAEEKRARVKESLPKTPKIQKEALEKYPSSNYTPSSQKILVMRETNKKIKERNEKLFNELHHIDEEEQKRRTELANEQKHKKQEEEKLKREALLAQYAKVIEQEKLETIKKQEENKELEVRVATLQQSVDKLSSQYEAAQSMKAVAADTLNEMHQELQEKRKELVTMQEQMRALRFEARDTAGDLVLTQEAKTKFEEELQDLTRKSTKNPEESDLVRSSSSSAFSTPSVEVSENVSSSSSSSVSSNSSNTVSSQKRVLPKSNLGSKDKEEEKEKEKE